MLTKNNIFGLFFKVFDLLAYCIHNRAECPLLASHESFGRSVGKEIKRSDINEPAFKTVVSKIPAGTKRQNNVHLTSITST